MDGLTGSEIIQFAMSGVLTIGIGVVGWFVSKIFEEIKRSRDNERELYQKVGETEKDILKLHIKLLEDRLENNKE